MTHDVIQTKLPIIVKMSPFLIPETINIAPEKQNPIKATSSNLQSFSYFFVLFELLRSNFSLICAIHISI